jgi:hypothetical protein
MIAILCVLSIWGLMACREEKIPKTSHRGIGNGSPPQIPILTPAPEYFMFRENEQGQTVDHGIGLEGGVGYPNLLPLPEASLFRESEDVKTIDRGIRYGNDLDQPSVTPVPEPPTIILLGLGLIASALAIRHGNKSKK